MVIYDKVTGLIERVIHPDDMIEAYRDYYKDNSSIEIIPEHYRADPKTHYVVDGVITMMEDYQIQELGTYRRFLTRDERVLESMKPSPEEVKQAEETIRMIELIQEAMM